MCWWLIRPPSSLDSLCQTVEVHPFKLILVLIPPSHDGKDDYASGERDEVEHRRYGKRGPVGQHGEECQHNTSNDADEHDAKQERRSVQRRRPCVPLVHDLRYLTWALGGQQVLHLRVPPTEQSRSLRSLPDHWHGVLLLP